MTDNTTTSVGEAAVPATSGMSRRTMVRSGAHLAWAVPAITMVTAAPSFAVSGPPTLPPSTALATAGSVSPSGAKGSVVVSGLANGGGQPIVNPVGDFVIPSSGYANRVAEPWVPVGAFAKASSKSYRVVLFASIAPGSVAPPIHLGLKKKKRKRKLKGTVSYLISGSGASVAGSVKLAKG